MINTGIFKEALLCDGVKYLKKKNSKASYKNPPIPSGFEHVCGKWNSGFVIECKFDRSQFVWIPVGFLRTNGTLDGNFLQKNLDVDLLKKKMNFRKKSFTNR